MNITSACPATSSLRVSLIALGTTLNMVLLPQLSSCSSSSTTCRTGRIWLVSIALITTSHRHATITPRPELRWFSPQPITSLRSSSINSLARRPSTAPPACATRSEQGLLFKQFERNFRGFGVLGIKIKMYIMLNFLFLRIRMC